MLFLKCSINLNIFSPFLFLRSIVVVDEDKEDQNNYALQNNEEKYPFQNMSSEKHLYHFEFSNENYVVKSSKSRNWSEVSLSDETNLEECEICFKNINYCICSEELPSLHELFDIPREDGELNENPSCTVPKKILKEDSEDYKAIQSLLYCHESITEDEYDSMERI